MPTYLSSCGAASNAEVKRGTIWLCLNGLADVEIPHRLEQRRQGIAVACLGDHEGEVERQSHDGRSRSVENGVSRMHNDVATAAIVSVTRGHHQNWVAHIAAVGKGQYLCCPACNERTSAPG